MQTTVQKVSLPHDRRVLVTSDIHGHADLFRRALEKAGFCRDDILVIIGDFIEKGGQSLETVRAAMRLCQDHTVYPLMGNVDLFRVSRITSDDPGDWQSYLQWSLNAKRWWGGSMLHEMCGEMGIALSPDMDMESVIPLIRRHFAPEIGFLSSLPTMSETEEIIFVHGGIPHQRLDELTGRDCFEFLKYDNFIKTCPAFDKWVVVGHWPVVLNCEKIPCANPLIDEKRRVIGIDGGCGVKENGQLNLLILPEGRAENASFLAVDDLPSVIALEDQREAPATAHIHWGDHDVTVLERGQSLSRVLFHGQEMQVPTQYLFEEHGQTCCSDVTDYTLPVRAGDELKRILVLPDGMYAKKNGVFGWYKGPWKEKEA